MPWYRAALIAFLIHLVIFGSFVFTFKGTREMYKTDFVFWGSILRPQEVAAENRRLSPGAVDVKDVAVAPDPRLGFLLWARGISIDKPDFFRNALLPADQDLLRFVGERVELEDPDDGMSHPENDVPYPAAPIKMRLEQL